MPEVTVRAKSGTMTEREYLSMLNETVDELMEQYPGTHAELAEHAGLSQSTIYKLAALKTKRPQLRTILRMAKAIGVRLVFDFTVTRNAKPFKRVLVRA